MKLSLVKVAFALLFSVPTILSPAKAGEYGYWREGYWCDFNNNYCRENNYNDGWDNQNYYQQLESIEYNGSIIRTGIRPNTDICSLVKDTLNQNHCDGFKYFDHNTRTHIFRNYSHQQYYPNNQWDYQQQHRNWRRSTPTWNGGGCVYQNKHVRILCN